MSPITRRAMLKGSRAGLAFGLWAIVLAEPAPAEEASLTDTPRVVLRGYDPVSYFTDGRAEKGSQEFQWTFDDATYLFKSAEHRDMFAAAPDHYAPQYAGFCAGGISGGVKIEGDPEAWVISDGKLFVFWAKSEIPKFQAKSTQIISNADARWQSMFGGH